MDPKRLVRISKFLSRHLRHAPGALGLTLQPGGWVGIDELLAGCQQAGLAITRAELEVVVASNDKRRFAFDETGMRIRANQGHSVDVDLQLEPADPPDVLYHGTAEGRIADILRAGLKRMGRHHVHLSTSAPTATKVGARHGRPAILVVDAAAMRRAGIVFYCSANGVWLIDEVPPQYLRLQ